MGDCPDWFVLLRAARWLGVAPWELAERSQAWVEWTMIAMKVEHVVPKEF